MSTEHHYSCGKVHQKELKSKPEINEFKSTAQKKTNEIVQCKTQNMFAIFFGKLCSSLNFEQFCCCRRSKPVSEAEEESEMATFFGDEEFANRTEDLSVWDMPFGTPEQEAQVLELRRLVHIDQEKDAEIYSLLPEPSEDG